jgi:hypothetical protein
MYRYQDPKPSDWGARLWPIWREWAAMGEFLRDDRGLAAGLEYLIGEKFLGCMPSDIPEELDFAREIQGVFTAEQMEPYFKKLMRTRQPQELARRRRARRLLLGR